LGAGYAAALVVVAVQKMWLPWSIHLGRWKSGLETSGRMEKKGILEGFPEALAQLLISDGHIQPRGKNVYSCVLALSAPSFF